MSQTMIEIMFGLAAISVGLYLISVAFRSRSSTPNDTDTEISIVVFGEPTAERIGRSELKERKR